MFESNSRVIQQKTRKKNIFEHFRFLEIQWLYYSLPFKDFLQEGVSPEVFFPKKLAIFGIFGDIATFGDLWTEIKSSKIKNAWAFQITSYFEKFFYFIRRLTIGLMKGRNIDLGTSVDRLWLLEGYNQRGIPETNQNPVLQKRPISSAQMWSIWQMKCSDFAFFK